MSEMAHKDRASIMAVRGRELVNQAHRRLLHEGVTHGVLMANHWYQNARAHTQVCSIDTLTRRRLYPKAELVVIDEAHLFVSDQCKEFVQHYRDQGSKILAVTATPYTRDSLEHLADVVVNPTSMQGLIDQGFLLPPVYFAPSTPDLSGIHSRHGDFVSDQLEERMSSLTGDIPLHWKQFAEDRPTIAFAVNIRHSLSIVSQLNRAGIPAEHIEGDHSESERQAAMERLKNGTIKVLSNVGVLCTGVDLPFVSCILAARPTKSYNLYIQQAGRGTRLSPETGKKNFIYLDHAGNVLRHGLLTDEPEVELKGIKIEYRGPRLTTCEKCFVIFEGSVCHACGWQKAEAPVVEVEPELDEGVLEKLQGLPQAVEIAIFIRRMRDLAKRRDYDKSYAYYQTRDKYGEEIADTIFPTQARRRKSQPWFLRSRRQQ